MPLSTPLKKAAIASSVADRNGIRVGARGYINTVISTVAEKASCLTHVSIPVY